MSIKASVIMPSYNTPEKHLREAIESILSQSFKDFEFIIIDDCSNESIESIVASYNDTRIVFLRNEKNLGLIDTLNAGLNKARGEYIFRMDSDDIAHPKRLENQLEFLDINPDIDVLGTAFEKFPKKQTVVMPLDDKTIKYTMIFSHNALAHPSVAMRKSTLDRLNMQYNPNHEICEDYGMWLTYSNEIRFANLEDVLLSYRWSSNNISKKKTDIQSTNAQYLMIEAQGKYFNINSKQALEAILKFKNKKPITSKELMAINAFVTESKKRLALENPQIKYNINRQFYKIFLKKCIKDFKFVQILFSKQFDEIIKLTFFQKIGILFGL